MYLIMILLAAIEETPNVPVLYGVISALATALGTTSIFLFNRITRTESRLAKQLKEEAENCEASRKEEAAKCETDKAKMFAFTMKLMEYIAALTKMSCSMADCPARRGLPAMPRMTAADMGLGDSPDATK